MSAATKIDPRTAPYYFTPTARSAATLDEFLAICRAEPSVAEHHLRAGWFGPWLSDAGYTQLAAAALADQAERPLEAFLAAAERRPRRRATTARSTGRPRTSRPTSR
jgi:hypothetical protein